MSDLKKAFREAPLNDWLPISNADFRNWGPWIYHGMKKRPAHVRVSLSSDGEADVAIYLTESGSGWGRNHSPAWEEITWYRLRCGHPYYYAARTDLPPTDADYALQARVAELEAVIDSSEHDGHMWRFWSDKARELATKNAAAEALLSEAVKAGMLRAIGIAYVTCAETTEETPVDAVADAIETAASDPKTIARIVTQVKEGRG